MDRQDPDESHLDRFAGRGRDETSSSSDHALVLAGICGSRGTKLFVSLSDPGRYLTVARFTVPGAWRAFLTEHRDAYTRLDAASKGLTTDECELAGGEVG